MLKSFEILFLLFDSLDKNFSQIIPMRLLKKVQSSTEIELNFVIGFIF